jgi:hypothetical protein
MDIQGLTFFFLFFFSFSLLGEVKIFQLTVKNEKIKKQFLSYLKEYIMPIYRLQGRHEQSYIAAYHIVA